MVEYQVYTGEEARRTGELLDACRAVFEEFPPLYLTDRLPRIADPALVAARFADGSLAGFKLGYRRGASLFYSWLGGVHPRARRQGVARELTIRQHELARQQGYEFIETRTRAQNVAMLILNLQAGFRICGFEANQAGHAVVSFRKPL